MARTPANAPKPDAIEALSKWPRPPKSFSDSEKDAWRRLGKVLMAARLVTAADVLMAEECARVMAKVSVLYEDKDLKATTLKGWVDLQSKMLGELGLSPKSRKNIAVPSQPAQDPESERRKKLFD